MHIMTDCLKHQDPLSRIAARFSAKELTAKARGTDICAFSNKYSLEGIPTRESI